MRDRIDRAHMAHVTFRDPATTEVQPDVMIDVDVELGRFVALRGRTNVGHGARIGDGVILTDVEVGPGAVIEPYTVASGSVIAPRATVGPFAWLQPGTGAPPMAENGYAGKVAKKYTAPRKSG